MFESSGVSIPSYMSVEACCHGGTSVRLKTSSLAKKHKLREAVEIVRN